MSAKRFCIAVILVVTALYFGTIRPHALQASLELSRRRARHLQGRVLDQVTKQALERARIRVLPSRKGPWSTDARGRFSFWVSVDLGQHMEIEHEGYRTVYMRAKPGALGDIMLELFAPGASPTGSSSELMPASQSIAPAIITADSGPKISGIGHAWSCWYSLGVGRAPAGYTVQKVEFWLTGDRGCGAWAECHELVRNDAKVTWEFRLQGHDEIGAPGASVSTAHIRVIYRSDEPEASNTP
jgi:hypothetical protein